MLDRVGVRALVSASDGKGEEMLDGLLLFQHFRIYTMHPYKPLRRTLKLLQNSGV